jgi:outer membrane protein TolC
VGSGDLRGVLQQNVAVYAARTGLIRVQTDRRIQRVNLYLAVGGALVPPPEDAKQAQAQPDACCTAR